MRLLLKTFLFSAITVISFTTASYTSATSNNSSPANEEVFKSAAVMPSYPGGDEALFSFINSNIQYPQTAQDNGIQGKVIVQFVVEKDGSIGEVKVARGVDHDLDKEALRVCKMLTGFTPGRNKNGDSVRVWYTLPVTFFTPEDPNVTGEALKYYQDALNGDAKAQNSLAWCYDQGNGVKKDPNRAVFWYRKSADQGNMWAMDNLGWSYEHGEGVNKDYDQAVYWYRRSAEHGSANACNNLGRCYEYEYGVEKDYDQAVYWYRKAAEGDNAYGINNLGECYYSGNGVEQDYEQAFLLYYKAAKKGIPRAQNNLANCYYDGTGVAQDIAQAIYWYSKAAEQGSSLAMEKLPSANALTKDYDNMRYWYQKRYELDDEYMDYRDTGTILYNVANDIYPNKNYLPILQDAVNQGSPGALSTLACLYAIGKDVERDDNKATELYRLYLLRSERYDKNISIADVYYFISSDYSKMVKGQYDTPRDRWIEKAAELGHSEAQYVLADKFAGEDDYENAILWWKKAAANNNSDAMCKLGDCYNQGLGVAKDGKTAFQWYKKAADNGDSFSQNLVGESYLKGDMLPRSEKNAAKYFTMSAENGNSEAKYNLAKCYFEGKGVKKDNKLAAEWFAEVCYVYLMPQPQKITEFNIVADELVYELPKTVEELREDDIVIGGTDDISKSEEEFSAWKEYKNVEQYNDENALLWLENAAENGNTYAAKNLAFLYGCGQGVERDYNKALYWYKKGNAHKEDASIVDMLSALAKEDFRFYKNKYLFLMQQASDFGSTDDMLNLTALYAIGKDVPRDDYKAIEYYRQYLEAIAEPTTNVTIADVYYLIYCNYYDNEIIELSCDEEREQWLEKAVELGNADAQYEKGNLSDDIEDAMIWYRKAAEQGHAGAQCEMGNYYNDKGDYAQAAQWFTKSAAQDDPEAQYRLATLYSAGKGVKKDKKLANEYYYKSATGFKASAEEALERE
mgnify:CR=1 FL=1